VLFNRGDSADGFFIVCAGQIKLAFTSADGGEKVVEIINPGQSFGEAVMFMGKPYPVMAQALAPSQLIQIPADSLFAEIDRDPKLARKMIAGLSMRLHRLINDVESYSMHSARERVIGYLLREADADRGSAEVHLVARKGVIASRLNLTQEHFSRVLHELAEHRLIVVEGRDIHIADRQRLADFRG
jgi:CRP-like cAMP-binding protein